MSALIESLDENQRAVALALVGPVRVLAGAGSGKTRALTYRLARFLDTGMPAERILLLTFTNRSAKEMLKRVGELCGPDALRITGGTFHHVANALSEHFQPALDPGGRFHDQLSKYLNKRAEYVKAIWSAINWNTINARYAAARKDG
jgi:DNA helicase-2/ATP-dependent DNA helicase PcrA